MIYIVPVDLATLNLGCIRDETKVMSTRAC